MNSSPRKTRARVSLSLFSVLTFLVLCASFALAGTLDTGFGSGGGTGTSVGANDYPVKVYALPDGKILVAGVSSFVGFHLYVPNPILARFNNDGTLDTSFGTNGVVNGSPVGSATVADVIMQPDGKIVMVGGANPTWNQPPADFAIERFNVDGSKDT
ncbi:MAG: hypothetical protein JOZ52_12215, partial [Acidobacteria bacterium]|nr:hypothetical protein [Acidobacteriota bacterium]